MKIFHLSDLHIGIKLVNKDLYEDQKFVFEKVRDLCKKEQPDVIVIAGDIYDKSVPSADAVGLFDNLITELTGVLPKAQIMMISGNHDSAVRVNVFRSVLSRHNIHMIGLPPGTPEEHIEKIVLMDEYGPVNFYLLPFVKPSMVKAIVGSDEKGDNLSYNETVRRLIERENINTDERNVIVSHQFYLPKSQDPEKVFRCDSEIRAVGNIDEVDADVLNCFDYAALGHIHRPMTVGNEFIRYCGTLMQYSVSEEGQEKSVVSVELKEKGSVKVSHLPVEPLHKVRVIKGTLDEVLKESCNDYVRIVLTDKVDLDVIDMQDRIRRAFPNHLDISRETAFKAHYHSAADPEKQMDAFELCCSFIGEPDDEEKALLLDVINAVKGV